MTTLATRDDTTRYEFHWLERHMHGTARQKGERLGITRRSLVRLRTTPLNWVQADHYATRLGLNPGNVWPWYWNDYLDADDRLPIVEHDGWKAPEYNPSRPIGGADDPRHGTPHGYCGLGCRCDRCTAANTDRTRRWYQSHRRAS